RLRGHDGAVVDFIYTTFWPTFNVADSCIVIGGALLVVVFLRSPAKRRSPPSHTGTRPEVGNGRWGCRGNGGSTGS
ncbi:MAG: signal peptidase II, partial [Actinobacteria bacterium]|nr:signal peptidase II [Actinomycetota bacterium]